MNMMTYLRFVIMKKDEKSGFRQGLFQTLAALSDRGELLSYERDVWDETRKWFEKNLAKPTSFARSKHPHAESIALSWFKDSAIRHIQHMRILVELLEEHGLTCEIVYSERPGYIVYEDDFQVAAEPFSDTAT